MSRSLIPPEVKPYPYPLDRQRSETANGNFGAEELNRAFEVICLTGGRTAHQVGQWLKESGMDFSTALRHGFSFGSDRRIDRILGQLKRDDLIVFDRGDRVWRPSRRVLLAVAGDRP